MEKPLVGKKIKSFMDIRHVSQKSVSDKTGISISTLRRILKDITNPTIDQLNDIASSLNLTISDLLYGDPLNYALTGHSNIDQLLLKACHIRSLPPGPERDSLLHQTHTEKAGCWSLHYRNYLPLADNDGKVTRKGHTFNLLKYPRSVDLMGIHIEDEIKLNDLGLQAKIADGTLSEDIRQTYIPICAWPTGRRRIQLIIGEIFKDKRPPAFTIEDYIFTARLSDVISGSSQAYIKEKLWRKLPDYKDTIQRVYMSANSEEYPI